MQSGRRSDTSSRKISVCTSKPAFWQILNSDQPHRRCTLPMGEPLDHWWRFLSLSLYASGNNNRNIGTSQNIVNLIFYRRFTSSRPINPGSSLSPSPPGLQAFMLVRLRVHPRIGIGIRKSVPLGGVCKGLHVQRFLPWTGVVLFVAGERLVFN